MLLEVDDEGPGIPRDERAAIWEAFQRGSDAATRPGSGLGLALVREAARAHGGDVELETSPAGGALFRVRLPISEDAS